MGFLRHLIFMENHCEGSSIYDVTAIVIGGFCDDSIYALLLKSILRMRNIYEKYGTSFMDGPLAATHSHHSIHDVAQVLTSIDF